LVAPNSGQFSDINFSQSLQDLQLSLRRRVQFSELKMLIEVSERANKDKETFVEVDPDKIF